ncbi:MAG: PTS cellobiose transporter subunit IIB [Miniphocaeibacter sp.]|uniref:PTS cellobiose transporter subunit IIB n=1 Tax=Miniphocaeibacter sp. TaxID=3100973 RepID=UPI00178D85D7|nr:PTS cellobiose transporter subunit IIB [Gallicola sp.]
MKKAVIICVGAMSSSVMAKKTTDYFKNKGEEIQVDASSVGEGKKQIEKDEYDLYLLSPQAKMNYDSLNTMAKKSNKEIVNIPFDAYVPIPMGIEKLAKLIENNI